MRPLNKISISLLFIFVCIFNICHAQDFQAFQAEVNADNINIRTDATVNSEIICKVNKGQTIEVTKEFYDWYKIRLPKNAWAYIKKIFVTLIDDKSARVLKDRVNVRLRPNESSPILGRVNNNEIINLVEDKGEWYRIEPVNNSFGWIHKRFVSKIHLTKIEEAVLPQKTEKENNDNITIEGIISPYGKIFKLQATHKLLTPDKKVFLLKGKKEDLDAFNYRKVKLVGKLVSPVKQKYPIIEIIKIETLN